MIDERTEDEKWRQWAEAARNDERLHEPAESILALLAERDRLRAALSALKDEATWLLDAVAWDDDTPKGLRKERDNAVAVLNGTSRQDGSDG